MQDLSGPKLNTWCQMCLDLLLNKNCLCWYRNQSRPLLSVHWKACWITRQTLSNFSPHRDVWFVSWLRPWRMEKTNC